MWKRGRSNNPYIKPLFNVKQQKMKYVGKEYMKLRELEDVNCRRIAKA